MLLAVPYADGHEPLSLYLPGSVVLEARALVRDAGIDQMEAAGLAVLVVGLPATQAQGLALLADRGSLRGMGGAALDALVVAGLAPRVALSWARAVAVAVLDPSGPPRAVQAPPARPAARPAPVAPSAPDPYPGLARQGETWPQFQPRSGDGGSLADRNAREEWRAAGMAHEQGRLEAWMSEVGHALGFTWEPPAGGG
jgi:hypothetical protein